MRALSGFCIALICATALSAQYRGNATPYITGGFGSVVHPGGTPANSPGIIRFNTNAAHPGGGGPQLVVPFSSGNRRFSRGGNNSLIYSYPFPIYVGGYGGFGGYDYSGGGYPEQPVVAAPQQASAPPSPIIINIGLPNTPPAPAPGPPPESAYQPSAQQQEESTAEPVHYLIAFKDHTIYSAVAYWVEGSTLHYFTNGNVHNQVSLSLIDRELTQRLNRETGQDVSLPAAK